MVNPDYYWQLIDYLDEHQLPSTISLTSNLWPFYKKPSKWTKLFNHERVGVHTSFEYGGQRMITKTRSYTEQDFRNVSDTFLEHVGYRPDFISVINTTNELEAIKNVELAADLGVECKLNYAHASGRQSKPYQLSKIYATYLQIVDLGLARWEYNTKQMLHRLSRGTTTCPQSRNCDTGIRALNPEGDYYSCGSLADDKDMPIDFDAEMESPKIFTPLQDSLEHLAMKGECLTCPMFKICNGCRKTITDHKRHGMVEQHCRLMKKNASRILELTEEWKDTDIIELGNSPSNFGGVNVQRFNQPTV